MSNSILITGGAHGIGRAVAQMATTCYDKVYILDKDIYGLAVANDIVQAGKDRLHGGNLVATDVQ